MLFIQRFAVLFLDGVRIVKLIYLHQEHVICAFTAEMDSKHESFDVLADSERAAEELQK